jgi:Putative metal-binding motif
MRKVALYIVVVALMGCGTSVFDEEAYQDPGPVNPPGYQQPPSDVPIDPGVDADGDGFNGNQGDCNEQNKLINPAAMEVAGLRCHRAANCASGDCVDGFCRCSATADCSSAATCTKHRDCAFAGESCVNGACTSATACLPAQAGLSGQGKICRDNVDNDCNGKIDELPGKCDSSALSSGDPLDYALALELCGPDRACGTASPCPTGLTCRKGRCSFIKGASFNAGADSESRALAARFAKNGPFMAKAGQRFVILSTGKAVYDPKVTCPQSGTSFTNEHTDPDPAAGDSKAFDYVELALRIKVPANANSFDFSFHFFSAEYPEWLSSKYNDTFWVRLESQKFTGNISFDKNNTPIRIKSAFFDICDAIDTYPETKAMCTRPAQQLDGTGYARDCKSTYSGAKANGGSTGWLQTSAPVTPGETIRLVFSIFDKGDHSYDSAVLIDNFRWRLTPANKPFTGTIE